MSQGFGQPAPGAKPAREGLGLFIGEWNMVGTHPAFSSEANGRSTVEWLSQGILLLWRFAWEPPGPPSALSVVGLDDSGSTYTMLYSDERGVARIYQIGMEGHTWKMWRDAPGFSQRMTWTFSHDGDRIMVRGHLSRDGTSWEPDLDVIYTRTK